MTVDHRAGPRRRGEVLEDAIVDAVIAELEERGYAALSVDAIARRARVSKASLYRRWPGKPALVITAVYRRLPEAADAPDTGSLRGDLLAAFRDAADRLDGPLGESLRGLLGDVLGDADVAAEFRAYRKGRGAHVVGALVLRAIERGELAGGVPPARLEVGHGMLRHEFLFTGAVSDAFIVSLVDDVMLPLLAAPSSAA